MNGDDRLREAGIVLPCAKQFGFHGFGGPSILSRCDRPYGHTGAHAAEGFGFTGARDADDEARTMFVLTRLLSAGVEAP